MPTRLSIASIVRPHTLRLMCARPRRRRTWRVVMALWFVAIATVPDAGAQERPAKRIANIVGVAVEEYAKGVDSSGRLISLAEYEEAVGFLAQAREAAARLSGGRADGAKAGLDSLAALMGRRVPVSALRVWVMHINQALGADAALDLPRRPIDLAAGHRLYDTHCASCHGPRGLGDGPLAKAITPPPPALGSAAAMHDRSPALMYRILSVGVAGTKMPEWASTLSPEDRWDIVTYVNSMRAPSPPVEGQGLYVQRCAVCHGASGASNGPMSASLARLPAELSSFAWQAERSDAQIAEAIRTGVPRTAMPASRDLSEREVESLVAFVRTLSMNDVPDKGTVAGAGDAAATARAVLGLLDRSLAAARAGQREDASDRAFDAYLTFEPLETPTRARDPGVVSSLERHFAEFKGFIRANDLRAAEGSRNAIEVEMPTILELARHSASSGEAFLTSLVIILREGLEAILVIGAIVAFLIKTGHRERLRSIWMGVIMALGASLLTAFIVATTLSAIPASREIIEGVTMLVAVGVLFSVSYWLISKVEAAKWQQFIREKVTAALEHGGGTTLAFVAFLAVYREGAETTLFYQALFQESRGAGLAIALGIAAGAAGLVVIFTLFHRYGVRIPLRPFFGVTSALLYYMAFVFLGKGVRELQEGNVVPLTVLPGWPHLDAMGIFPSVETLLAQFLLVVLFVFALLKTFWPRRAVVMPTVPAEAGSRVVDDRLTALAERMEQLARRVDAIEQSVESSSRDSTLSR